MANVGGATYTLETQSRNMMNICNKYGFDILIISGSNGGHRQYKTYDGQRRGHKLPTGEAKKICLQSVHLQNCFPLLFHLNVGIYAKPFKRNININI